MSNQWEQWQREGDLNVRYHAWVREGKALRDMCRKLGVPLLPELRTLYGGGTVTLANPGPGDSEVPR